MLTHFLDLAGDPLFFPYIEDWMAKGWVSDTMTCAIHRARFRSTREKDPEDARYNFVLWTNANMGFAIGPSRVDPRTGQILDADDHVIRRFSSRAPEDTESYNRRFPADPVVEIGSGMHRFVWDLRYERPDVVSSARAMTCNWSPTRLIAAREASG